MNRYFLEVAYNGTAFHGSQLQGDIPTVQYFIDKSLSTLLKQDIHSFGASRTDEGVHAHSAFFHFDMVGELIPELLYKLNCVLPINLSVKAIYSCIGNEPINARFDAIARTYRYKIYHRKSPFKIHLAHYFPFKINRAVLDDTAAAIMQFSNFESFSKRNTQSKTFQCTIFESYWMNIEDELHFVVKANRFLRGMVRGLVGTQLQIARHGNLKNFHEIIEAKNCTKANFSVPGHGLYLEKIEYPEGSFRKIF